MSRLAVDPLSVVLGSSLGGHVSTLCRIYNASGDRIRIKFDHSWRGYFYKESPVSTVENGQWTTFVHVHPTYQPCGNAGAVIYGTAVDSDIFLGWQNPFHPAYNPTCWAEEMGMGKEEGKRDWWNANSQANMLQLLDYKANRCMVEGKDYTVISSQMSLGTATIIAFCAG